MKTIGGTIFTHDCEKYDYTWRQSIESMLGVCDEVVCVDAESTDGTKESLEAWSEREPKLKLFHAGWNPVVGKGGAWLADLANKAREYLTTDYHINCQADEVFHPGDYDLIRECAEQQLKVLCHRLNFWIDHNHLAPHGHVCGHRVIRCGDPAIKFVGDAECLEPDNTEVDRPILIFHYGFIRRQKEFVEKLKSLQTCWHGDYDQRVKDAEAKGVSWYLECPFPEPLIDFTGEHPPAMRRWLAERGFYVDT